MDNVNPSPDNQDLWKEYIDKGTWKCEKSPTKAHYWQEVSHEAEEGAFVCKHCDEKRKMPNSWGGALSRMAKKLGKPRAITNDS